MYHSKIQKSQKIQFFDIHLLAILTRPELMVKKLSHTDMEMCIFYLYWMTFVIQMSWHLYWIFLFLLEKFQCLVVEFYIIFLKLRNSEFWNTSVLISRVGMWTGILLILSSVRLYWSDTLSK